ncbi:MAG TPA: lysophospholipid acyltransferase family protein, partial [Flavobacterium lutivivi]|nr:lysophospholipid acyltransferase family protein [Flavobacterium lutivivi]
MQKIVSYPLSLVAILFFILTLLIFHPIQWLCLNLLGYQAHKKSVDYLNLVLLRISHLLGTSYKVENRELIPKGVPIIFVANHQSLYDIVAMIWFFRKFHPKFVSKKELGKNIPSVSYNLRHGGSVLIDRKDPKQAVPTIKILSDYIELYKRSAVIFPEGTRSKTGIPKEF